MANTISTQTLADGPRNLIVKVTISGDGSGDEADTSAIDVSSYNDSPSEVRIDRVKYDLDNFGVTLKWDATSNVDIMTLEGSEDMDFCDAGGLINNAGAGVTGDIVFDTNGLAANETGYFVLYMKKREVTNIGGS